MHLDRSIVACGTISTCGKVGAYRVIGTHKGVGDCGVVDAC